MAKGVGGGRGPSWTRVEKPRDLRASAGRLFSYMGPYRKHLVIGIVLAMVSSLLSLIGPQYISDITDSIQSGITSGTFDTGLIFNISLILIAMYSAGVITSMVQHIVIGASSEMVGANMRQDLSSKINRVPLSILDRYRTGEVMSRFTNDCHTVSNGCSESVTNLITSITMLIGGFLMMLVTDVTLTIVAVIPVMVGFIILYLVTTKTTRFFRQQSKGLGELNALVEEVYGNHEVVRAYNGMEGFRSDFEGINENLHDTMLKARIVTAMVPQLMGFLNNMEYVLVCIVGSILILDGDIGYGTVVAFIIYVRLFTNPVVHISESISRMQSVISASERVFEILDLDEMPDTTGKGPMEQSSGRIEFRNVCFSYTPDREIIHNLNLVVEPGSKIAIVGPTGSGKTTIANLLMRFYDIDSGDILIDGTSIKDTDRGWVHDKFCYVLQDSWLFEGTVADNISFTNPDMSRSTIEAVCQAVGIDGFVESLPQGYDTVLDEKTGLSAGQKQQLAIARALARDAPMIILDEATSSVDTRTEKKIQEAMDILTFGRTSFIIAHRLSTIVDSDLILVMRDGSIVERGTHDELLAIDGFYRTLYDSQFENCD